MNHNPASWGQPYSIKVPQIPLKHSQDPIVTGASIIALKYKDGVMMASDTLASYGSLARFRNVQRLNSLDDNVLLGTSGDIGDMQFTLKWLYEFALNERLQADGHHLAASNYYTLIQQLLYKRRSDMDPLWNTHVIAGPDFLGAVDLRGTCWTSDVVATGFGSYLALPMLRDQVEGRVEEIDETEARILLEKCMQILWSRHARASNMIQYAKVTSLTGVEISQPIKIKTDWSIAYI